MKVKCRDCSNELNGKCEIKKVSVKVTKFRNCDSFSLDRSRELQRQAHKEKVLRRQNIDIINKQNRTTYIQETHPLTGDLSKFKTTAI